MYYIVDTYTYYVYNERECNVTVLAMSESEKEIRKFAKRINEDSSFSHYFGYCHVVCGYRTLNLLAPYKFEKMTPWLSFHELLK